MKHLVHTKIGTAYLNFFQSVLGFSDEEGNIDTDSDKQRLAPKKIVLPIKNIKKDSNGVSPLKDKDSCIIIFTK